MRLLFTSRLPLQPSTSPLPSLPSDSLLRGAGGEGTGAEPLGGARHSVSCPWSPGPGGWCSSTGSAAEMPWGPLQAPPQPRRWSSVLRQPALQTPLTWPTPRPVEMQSVATQGTFRAIADCLHTRPGLPRTPHFSCPRAQF